MADVRTPLADPAPGRLGQLGAFMALAIGCAALLATTYQLTAPRIADARARLESRGMLWLLDATDLPAGAWANDRWRLCDGTMLLRGEAAGYGGAIHWMLAIETDRPTIRRVLVTAHQETPGIADFLNDPSGGWLAGLAGRGPDDAGIDTVTGATITTRALARSLMGAMADATAATDTAAPPACAP